MNKKGKYQIFSGRFPEFLCKAMKDRGLWFATKWEDGTLTGDLIFIFKGGGALKVDMANMHDGPLHQHHRDKWTWFGAVGGGMKAIEIYCKQKARGPFPAPMKRLELKENDLRYEYVPDLSITPAEAALEQSLSIAKCRPGKKRKLNKDGSLRFARYSLGKGTEIKLVEGGSLEIEGEMGGVFLAVREAEREYVKSLPAAPPPPPPKYPNNRSRPRGRRRGKQLAT